MSSTVLPSFLFYIDILSSLKSPYNSQLSLSHSLYWNRSKAPTSRSIPLANNQVWLSFWITLSDSLNTNMLEAFNNLDKDIEFSEVDVNWLQKLQSIKHSYRKTYFFYFDSNFSSVFSSEAESNSSSKKNFWPVSDNPDSDNRDNKDEEISQLTHNNFYISNNSYISSCNTNYAREKLVKILASEVVIPKQYCNIDKILATLTYHRKDHRVYFSYYQFK